MNEHLQDYIFRDQTIKLPRQWVELEDLREIAIENEYKEHQNLPDLLQSQGIDVNGDKVDFTGVNLSLLNRGTISSEFLKTIIDSNFQDEFLNVQDLYQFLQEIEFEKLGKPMEPSDYEFNLVLSALQNMM